MLDFLVKAPNKMTLLLEDLKTVSEPLYLFGAGNCGEHYLHVLGENGIPVEAFLDDDPKKQKMGFHGKAVLSPEMMEGCAGTILISSYGPNTLMKRLERISPDLLKRVLWSEFFLWEDGLNYYSYYMKHAIELEQVYGLLEDERSKEVFRNLLNYKVSRDISLVTSINDLGCCDQYFDRSIVNFGQGEVFVDLGAYIGDTVDSFVKHIRTSGASYDHILRSSPIQIILLNSSGALHNILISPISIRGRIRRIRFCTFLRKEHGLLSWMIEGTLKYPFVPLMRRLEIGLPL